MYVVELLLHDTLAVDHLRVHAFLPDLIDAVDLVRALSESKTLEGAFSMRELEVVNDVSRRLGLEACHGFCKVWRLSEIVKVIF